MMKFRMKLGAVALAGGTAALVLSGVPALASSHAAKTVTGPEVIAGAVYGKAALARATRIPLQWSGLVDTDSVVTLGGRGPHAGSVKTLSSPAGNLTIRVTRTPTSHQTFNPMTCRFSFTEDISLTVVGSMSTGAFAGASGPGAVQVHVAANAPRYKSGPHEGQCNARGKPLADGAVASFLASTVLTLK